MAQDFYGGERFGSAQSAQTAREGARLRTLMYAHMDGRRAEEIAKLGYGMPDRPSYASAEGGRESPWSPLARQAGGKVGSLLAEGIGSLLGGGFKPPGTSFWPAASDIGNSTWQSGFSLGGSLLK